MACRVHARYPQAFRLPVRVVWRTVSAGQDGPSAQRPPGSPGGEKPRTTGVASPTGRRVPRQGDGGDVELAASTIDEDYAARMLGYDRKVFGKMIHAFKHAVGLNPDDHVIFHDNGDIVFNGECVGNINGEVP